ncbi:MAG: hypothetical protein ACOCX5_00070 [Chloroflexota bacterium]
MMQRIIGQLPSWMRANHPMLRYLLERRGGDTGSARLTRALFFIVLGGLFLLIGYANASNLFDNNPFDLPFSQLLIELFFWPTLILQVGLQITVLLIGINTIGEEKRRQTWESLRTTTEGAALAIRTRWSAVVFYRMRGALAVLLLVRVILIAGLLFDLTAFQGEYLRNLTGSIVPDVSLPVSVLLLAMLMTASLLLPVTGFGFGTALGLLLSTFVHQRTYVVLTQVTLATLRIAVVAALVFAVEQFRVDSLGTADVITWVLLFAFAIMGDWGLSFLHLGFYGAQVWVEVPYGILLGGAMMVFVLIQAVLTDVVLSLAIRRAERTE